MSVLNLKSVQQGRVIVANAIKNGSERQDLGHGEFCPAGAQSLYFDVYNRPVNQNTLDMRNASCSNYDDTTASNFMAWENYHRPYIPLCASGLRGGDTLGVGRDLFPSNVYGEGAHDFVRLYKGPTDRARDGPTPPNVYRRQIPRWTGSMDAEAMQYRG
jgi:hypothetical protein